MARKIIHQLVDDLDGTVLEPGAGETVSFSLDGKSYEIDLGTKAASKLRASLEPYVKAARRTGSTAPRRARAGASTDLSKVREWAKENGHQVSERGRVSAVVLEAYEAAH